MRSHYICAHILDWIYAQTVQRLSPILSLILCKGNRGESFLIHFNRTCQHTQRRPVWQPFCLCVCSAVMDDITADVPLGGHMDPVKRVSRTHREFMFYSPCFPEFPVNIIIHLGMSDGVLLN